MRFIDYGNFCFDTLTKLMWASANPGPMTWQDAINNAPAGWRLPTRREFEIIFNSEIPNMLPVVYWTSETYPSVLYSEHVWYVDFENRDSDHEYKHYPERVKYVKY